MALALVPVCTKVPPVMVVAPVYVLLPESVCVPAPVLLTEPLPLITPAKVGEPTTGLRIKVALLTIDVLDRLPSLVPLPSLSVPALMVVMPVKVLAPASV